MSVLLRTVSQQERRIDRLNTVYKKVVLRQVLQRYWFAKEAATCSETSHMRDILALNYL